MCNSVRVGMKMTYSQLKSSIPLYSDLAGLVLEFLEPCLDYSLPKCIHTNKRYAFCHCGNVFEFRSSWNDSERILLEKFCPFCGTLNPHKTQFSELDKFLVQTKSFLRCNRCSKHAESYDHKFCSSCQHKLSYCH